MLSLTIDVDYSNVCFKIGKNFQSLARHLVKWANTGLCVIPVCDAKVHPIRKQATDKRKADRDRNRIKASIIHKGLHSLHRHAYLHASN